MELVQSSQAASTVRIKSFTQLNLFQIINQTTFKFCLSIQIIQMIFKKHINQPTSQYNLEKFTLCSIFVNGVQRK